MEALRIGSKMIQGKAAHYLCSHSVYKTPSSLRVYVDRLYEVVLNAPKHPQLDYNDSQTIPKQ